MQHDLHLAITMKLYQKYPKTLIIHYTKNLEDINHSLAIPNKESRHNDIDLFFEG